jgi:hypothetical protein
VKRILLILSVLSVVPLFILGCGKKDSITNNPDNNNVIDVQLADYQELVSQIAPPEYGSSRFKSIADLDSAAIDTFWYWGEYPLLGKVFGQDEPMSLYRNIATLDNIVNQINMALDSLQHEGTDTFTITFTAPDTVVTCQAEVMLEALTAPVAIPIDCQPGMGFSEIALDYHLRLTLLDDINISFEMGFKTTDLNETFVCFQRMPHPRETPSSPLEIESSLFYANRDKVTDAIQIKEVFFKDQGDSTKAIWVFEIKTVNENDFLYRMTWYSDQMGDMSGMSCIIGGGNKDNQFALKYRQHRPATLPEPDPNDPYGELNRLFGPNYANLGDSIPEAYIAITNPDSMYHYDDLPIALLDNPLEAPNLINPWHHH